MSDDERLMKLPVWARDEVRNLRRRIRELNAAAETFGEQKPTRVILEPFRGMGSSDERPTYLPDRSRFRFMLGDTSYIDVRLDLSDLHPALIIQGRDAIVAAPSSSNVLEIMALDDLKQK